MISKKKVFDQKARMGKILTSCVLCSVITLSACTYTQPKNYYTESEISNIPKVQTNTIKRHSKVTSSENITPEVQSLQGALKSIPTRIEDRGIVLTLEDLQFPPNSAGLASSELDKLDRLISFLKKHVKLDVIIEGHTDNFGSREHNLELSRARAIAVYEQLAAAGISESRLAVIAMGDKHPIAPNNTEKGRRKNRRVEVVISGKLGAISEQ